MREEWQPVIDGGRHEVRVMDLQNAVAASWHIGTFAGAQASSAWAPLFWKLELQDYRSQAGAWERVKKDKPHGSHPGTAALQGGITNRARLPHAHANC